MKMVAMAEFAQRAVELIEGIEKDGEPVTVTRDGKAVAVLGPSGVQNGKRPSAFGALKGSVLKYERPFDPACDPMDWHANQ